MLFTDRWKQFQIINICLKIVYALYAFITARSRAKKRIASHKFAVPLVGSGALPLDFASVWLQFEEPQNTSSPCPTNPQEKCVATQRT
jgi:hypothetical protein